MRMFHRGLAVAASSALLVGVTALPAQAQQDVEQNGLVNVNFGNVTLTVPVALVANVAANVCDVDVGPIAVGLFGRATAVDNSGRERTICTAEAGGPVTITQDVVVTN